MEVEVSNMDMLGENDKVENLLDNVEVVEDTLNVEHKVDEPKIGMTFGNVDEMFDYYKKYANQMGFPVKRRTSKRGDDGVLKYVTFVCARSGKSKCTSSNALKPYPNMKTDCKARLGGCLELDGRWRLNSFILDHNHALSPSKSRFFRCNRETSLNVKRQLEVNDSARIRLNKNYNSFVVGASGHDNISFLEKDCKNYIEKVRRLQLREGDANAIQNYFLKMQAQNTGFFFSMDLDEQGRLRNVFWADLRSREAYKEFGEVITFDTTYLTSKYDMPFAPFVGVNHHRQSTLLGCGLISCEDTETFTWLFRTWLACMSGCAPSGIITDQDKAIQNAIEIVFPNSRHRWCLWHIMKKLPTMLGSYNQYEAISLALQGAVYDSQTPEEFEESWSVMVDKYRLHNNDWLSVLFNERRRWAPCFLKNSFWAGMSTTQRRESIKPFFHGYVNSKTTLKQFMEQYGNALRSKVEEEIQSDFRSFAQQVPCVTVYDMEKQVQGVYTISMFKEFQEELTGKMYCEFISIREDCMVSEYDVREDIVIGEGKKRRTIFRVTFSKDGCEVKCNCLKFEFRGIMCRHAIAVLIRNDVLLLPEKYILRRWRKDARRCHTRVKLNYDGWSATTEQLRYDKLCIAFTKVADLAVEDDENFTSVMEWIDTIMKELTNKKVRCGSNQPNPESGDNSTANESLNILDPVATRGKGRPPCRRKESKILKEQSQKRKKVPTNGNMEDSQNNGPSPFEVASVTPTEENMDHLIPTQESIATGNSQNPNENMALLCGSPHFR